MHSLLFSVLTGLSLGAAEPADRILPKTLVHCKAVRVEKRDEEQHVVLRIEHVYRGDATLTGQSCELVVPLSDMKGIGTPLMEVRPLIRTGENGIWALSTEASEKPQVDLNVSLLWKSVVMFPVGAREGISANYIEALAWAKAVEKVSKTTGGEQLRLLRDSCTSSNPSISHWAITTLGSMEDPDVAGFVKECVGRRDISLKAQIAADEVLCKLRKKDWWAADERLRLVKTWVSDRLPDADADLVSDRVHKAIQKSQFEYSDFLDVISNAVCDKKKPFHERAIWFQVFKHGGTSQGYDQQLAFRFLTKLIVESQEAELRLYAAGTLYRIAPLTKDQVRELTTIKDKTTDTEVVIELGKVIKSAVPIYRLPYLRGLLAPRGACLVG